MDCQDIVIKDTEYRIIVYVDGQCAVNPERLCLYDSIVSSMGSDKNVMAYGAIDGRIPGHDH